MLGKMSQYFGALVEIVQTCARLTSTPNSPRKFAIFGAIDVANSLHKQIDHSISNPSICENNSSCRIRIVEFVTEVANFSSSSQIL